jgi:HD-GYP domain-containing protein (c-di-GMP phosphodiesterase class II)
MAGEVGVNGDVALALADLSAADAYTLQHCVDVAALGLLIGKRLYKERGYVDYRGKRSFEKVDRRLSALALGLLLQDIGKLAIPREILEKRGPLDEDEWSLMRAHPLTGAKLLRSDSISLLVKATVRSHHERWDGGGYPDSKSDEEIHQHARIAAVADSYDAITSERYFSPARPAHIGVRTIRQGSGTLFDPEIVDAFSKIVAPYPPGDAIELTDGDGNVLSYRVVWTRLYQADTAPLDEIFAPTADEALTLITCGGAFDQAARMYVSRWVVRAVRTLES